MCRRFVTLPWQKLLFLSSCLLVSGSFGFLVPWVSHIHLLCLALLLVGFFIGSFNTANTSLVVYMFGPHKFGLSPKPSFSYISQVSAHCPESQRLHRSRLLAESVKDILHIFLTA